MDVSSAQAMTYSQPFSPSRIRFDSKPFLELAARIDDPRPEQFCHRIDDGRAADPFCLACIPFLFADDFIAWFESLFINVDAFDCAGRGAHPIFHVRAFERGTGRGGCADQAFAVAEHQFCIRADVDQQPVLILLVRFFGKDHRAGIRADKGGDGRQDMNIPG